MPIFALRFGGTAKEESESPERIKEKNRQISVVMKITILRLRIWKLVITLVRLSF